jgi:hypothetical protein
LPGTLPPATAAAANSPPPLPEGVPSRPAQATLESLRTRQPTQSGAQQISYETPAGAPAVAPQTNVETMSLVPQRRMSVTSIRLPDNYDLRAAAMNSHAPITRPITSNVSQQLPTSQMPAATPNLPPVMRTAAAGWPAAPTMPQPPGAVAAATRQFARPQFVTPQFMSLQPAAAPVGMPTTVTQPAAR